MLKLKGCQQFRQRLVCATLAGKALRIDDIRSQSQNPGLQDFEASLLRLIEKVTDGCVVEINETGTTLRYRPGVIVCGAGHVHDCGTSRGIGYFIEPLVLLALFAKKPLSITLRGITNDSVDPGVDTFRTVTLPLLRKLGIEEGLELKIVRRGARPGGGGEVQLKVPVMKQMPVIDLTDEGMVKRIRGVAYSTKVSPQNTNRMVDGARGVLNQLLADVYVFTDAVSGRESGNSPGYGLTLVAETTSGCLISAEACATAGGGGGEASVAANGAAAGGGLIVAEDVGRAAACALLEEIERGGIVDGAHQGLVLLLCALGPPEINQVRLGPLTDHAVATLRHIKEFLGVVFSMRPERESRTIFLSCLGSGLRNLGKKVT